MSARDRSRRDRAALPRTHSGLREGQPTSASDSEGPATEPGAVGTVSNGANGDNPDHADRGPTARRPWQSALALGALFLVVTFVMVFPAIQGWRALVPGDHGDALFSQWLIRWDVHALLSRSVSVFHPNMYWPAHDTLVYSDSTLAMAPVAAVVGFVVGWPLAYNVLYVAAWFASLAFTYLLARGLGASKPGAVLAAFVFSFAAVRIGHHGNFPMLSTFLVPLCILLLLRFIEQRRWWQVVGLALACAGLFLDAGYIAVAVFPALAVIVAGLLIVL